MSLILDALRKLDREKEAPERGLVVLGAPEPQRRASGSGVLALALMLGGALGGVFALLWLRGPARPPAPAAASLATPAAPVPAADPPAAPAPAAPTSPPPAGLRTSPRPAAVSTPAARPRSAAAPATPTPASPPPAAEPEVAAAAASAAPQPADDATEPTAIQPGAVAPEPRLEAISVRDGRPVAILSGRLVFEGDRFDGIQVLRIGASEVEIERDGRRQVLRF